MLVHIDSLQTRHHRHLASRYRPFQPRSFGALTTIRYDGTCPSEYPLWNSDVSAGLIVQKVEEPNRSACRRTSTGARSPAPRINCCLLIGRCQPSRYQRRVPAAQAASCAHEQPGHLSRSAQARFYAHGWKAVPGGQQGDISQSIHYQNPTSFLTDRQTGR